MQLFRGVNRLVRVGKQLYDRVRGIIESARAGAARSVDTAQVVSNWLIGREIVEEEQGGEKRAAYGRRMLEKLAVKLLAEYGEGYSVSNLRYCRQFSVDYPGLLGATPIHQPLVGELGDLAEAAPIPQPPVAESWRPGILSRSLCWRHYLALIRVDTRAKRDFYEIEAVKNNWSGRELERQINSLLYERLALSKDKAGVMELATKGQEISKPGDVFKDPLVLDFLGVPATSKLTESDLEEALIANMQKFLLELGRGFAFVARQERLTLDGDLFFVDLVFYHAVLKCYALVELKVGKLTHQDLGQMLFYVNYFDRERRTEGDGPTLGLILCTDKNDAVVQYTLGEANKAIFANRYKLHLPSEAELMEEVRREVRSFRAIAPKPDET
jgi:predicted nuclease of restriction endonuclease-like (RecB) superfamily